MKEIGKINKIFKGFFPDETVSEIVKEKRRSLCGSCEYNSANTPKDKLSSIDYLREKVSPPFCTLCKCQIFEKTQSPFEECAAYMADEPKKWFKTRIETMAKEDINITNLSDIEVDLVLGDNKFTIDYGVLNVKSETEIELLVDTNSPKEFKLHSVHARCGCTVTKFDTKNNTANIHLKLNMNEIPAGRFNKIVDIQYFIEKTPKKTTIVLTGFKN